MKKISTILFLCMFIFSTLISCNRDKNNTITDEEKIISNEDSSSAEDNNVYPITVDNYGREVTITKKPEKVLTLGPNVTELFVSIGLGDYVVGRSLVNHSREPLEEYADIINDIPILNNASATREAIITSGADFIYALDWEIGEEGCNIEEVSEYGMNVYVNSATTMEEIYKEIEDIGKIFGVEENANKFIENQKLRIKAVEDKLKNIEPVDVLIYDSGNDGVFTCSGINFESLLVKYAGGNNIFNDLKDKQWVTVSYEEILARNPDIILIHDYDTPSVEEKIAEIKSNPTLSKLDCVKNERFATISLESVLPGNRMAYSIESMAKDFYPDIFRE